MDCSMLLVVGIMISLHKTIGDMNNAKIKLGADLTLEVHRILRACDRSFSQKHKALNACKLTLVDILGLSLVSKMI